METLQPKFGRIVDTGDKAELRYLISDLDHPDTASEVTVVTWTRGDTNLVISVPHGGTVGSDTSPAGNLLCETGHLIETRKCTPQYPSLTYTRDAGTDVIAREIHKILAKEGLKPHVIECHIHRSKVECNRHVSEIAIQRRGQEAELVYTTFHNWIRQALQMGLKENKDGCLLIDLHGHGHPHEYIELGYRLTASLLNNIANEEVDQRNWRTIVTSSARHEFTMRHLMKRRFGTSNEAIREALIGQSSFAGCIIHQFSSEQILKNIKCVPSEMRIGPGKLGYYNGGFIVRSHSKLARVDSLQIELPMSIRCQAGEARDTAILAIAAAIKQFHNLHYNIQDRHVNGNDLIVEVMDLSDTDEEESMKNPVPPMSPPSTPSPPLQESPTIPKPSAGPPPPPPPPPLSLEAAPVSVCQDGIGQMTLMAKSKMHDELIRKAKLKNVQGSITTSVPPPSGPPATPPPLAPPAPPPPPAPSIETAPDNVSQDGIGQMTMMTKSRMHDELIRKAKRHSCEVEKTKRQATPPSPPLHPPGPCPPPPPPPPPPAPSQPSGTNSLSPNLDDSITHKTAMSKSRMHQELILKAKAMPTTAVPVTTEPVEGAKQDSAALVETEPDAKTMKRKKIVKDILDRNEPTSSSETRKLNEQRRRDFFENSPNENISNIQDDLKAKAKNEENVGKATSTESENSEEQSTAKVERPPRQKDRENLKEKVGPKKEEDNSKRSCTVS